MNKLSIISNRSHNSEISEFIDKLQSLSSKGIVSGLVCAWSEKRPDGEYTEHFVGGRIDILKILGMLERTKSQIMRELDEFYEHSQ